MFGPASAAPPTPQPVTPELIAAATKEGKVVFYSAIDLKVTQGLAKLFEKKYPGISVQVERSGSERLFQRVAQERANKIYAVDVLDGSDQALFVSFMVSRETQQYLTDAAGLRSFHPDVKLKPGRMALSAIKLLPSDPEAQEKATEEIKKKYAQYFGI